MLVGFGQPPVIAAVSAVRGSACGYTINGGPVGGPPTVSGCAGEAGEPPAGASPSVALPAGGTGSATAVTGADSGIFVSTQGTPAAGSVTSLADIALNPAPIPSPAGFGSFPVAGSALHAECTASNGAVSGLAAFSGAVLTTAYDTAGNPTATEPVPENPVVNYTRSGVNSAGDIFTVVYNQQVQQSDGSLIVNGLHLYLYGPTAVGDVVAGQATCGTTGSAAGPDDQRPAAGPPDVAAPGDSESQAAPADQSGDLRITGSPEAQYEASAAAVTAVRGGACGYFVNVGLFGGPQQLRGCGQPASAPAAGSSPSVTLPPGGSDTALTDSKPTGASAQYGPAVIFGGIWPADVSSAPPSGPISVSTQGTPGGGTVTSSADIVLRTPANAASPGGFGPPPLEGEELHVSCTASEAGVSASTRFVKGVLSTTTDLEGNPKDSEPIPDNPPANYTRSGVITNVGDVFTVVFNQQIINADGSLTVNAMHVYLFGPTAIGEMVKGQATCGTTPSPLSTKDVIPPGCGPLVIAPVGPEDPTPKVPLTQLIGVFDAGGIKSITNVQVTNGTVDVGNPSGLAYLKFTPGQTGPLAITATRSEQAETAGLPLTWSFDATDSAGNVTRSSQCPTGTPQTPGGSGGGTSTTVVNVGTTTGGAAAGGAAAAAQVEAATAAAAAATAAATAAAAAARAGTGSSSGRSGAAGMAKTGGDLLPLLPLGGALVAGGALIVLSTRRRRLAEGEDLRDARR